MFSLFRGSDSSSSDSFPFVFETDALHRGPLFALHDGHRKEDGAKECSVLVANNVDPANNVAKRLRTLRHPSILLYLGSSSNEKRVCIATERVSPLFPHLDVVSEELNKSNLDHYRAWGLYQILKALSFINHDAKLVHYNVRAENVFVNSAGDWKLFGIHDLAPFDENERSCSKTRFEETKKYEAPEIIEASRWRMRTNSSVDMWGFGCLIWEVYNGPLPNGKSLGKLGNIPAKLSNFYKQCVSANPEKRPEPKAGLEILRKSGSFFRNELIDALIFLEELSIKEAQEKTQFFNKLTPMLDNFPQFVCRHKILPELIKAFDFGNAGSSVLASLLKIGQSHLDDASFSELVVPCLVKMFASSDRNARFKLLNNIEHYVNFMSPKVVNEQIFANVCSGFSDDEPLIREKTVIAIMHLAPKLSYANLDEIVVMRHFSRLLRDPNPALRTNTAVCLGKIASYLHYNTRQKVLISAFSAKLRDPFPPARIAGLNALAATQQFVTIADTAAKVVPVIAPVLVDPEQPVRQQAFKVMKGFVEKLEQVSSNPELKEEMEAEVKSSRQSSQVVAAAASWASWAVGAIGAKFYKSNNEAAKEEQLSKPQMEQERTQLKQEKPALEKMRPPQEKKAAMSLKQEQSDEHTEEEGWDDASDDWGDMEANNDSDRLENNNLANQFRTQANVDVPRPSPPRAAVSDAEDRRRAREERQRERKAEMESKKEANNKKGPMKLGAKVNKKQLNDNLDDLDAWLK